MKAAAVAAACATILVLAGCSSDSGTTPSTPATTTRLTEITGPIPVPSVTVPVVSQPVPGVSSVVPPGGTTLPPPGSSPGPATTEANEPQPCDAPTLFGVAKASTDLPPETGAEAPSCSAPWASMVIGVPGQDRALGVFVQNPAGDWRLVNLGSDRVCSGAGVPPELYGVLGCALWETE